MQILWLSALLPFVFAQTEFGTSYLKNSQLCAQWTCLNDHLGLSDVLPPRVQYETILRGLLPVGPWQDAVGPALDACYADRPRRYTNTCPGQALLHCVVDQLIQNCPTEHWKSKDACAPLTSLAGLKYMFSQSRYNDIDVNLPSDRRPAWFLKNYFNVKCCDLPPLFSDRVLDKCGFNSIIHYYKQRTRTYAPTTSYKVEKKPIDDGFAIKVVPFDNVAPATPSVEEYGKYDPLDCCDIHEFIPPAWRSDCAFELTWNSDTRLSIENTTAPTTTTTTENSNILKAKDVKMVPKSCADNNCVFKALNIVSENGIVDIDAFSKLLNNLTDIHPAWVKAKGRVVTKCLSKPIRDYEYDCQINKVLACTFDILSENCPNSISPDICRHTGTTNNEVICQISSSKYRPKNRRLFCGLPNLVNHEVLLQCNMNSLIHLEYVSQTVSKPKSVLNSISSCKDSTPSTICLLDKMNVLNKYNFMDYFKMKDRIREFSHGEWFPYNKAFAAVFQTVPLYRDHCSSPKKLLNVIDTMLTTCPASKRRDSPQCQKMFSDLNADILKNGTQNEQLLKHFGHVLLTNQHLDIGLTSRKTFTNPMFDFGMFNSQSAPPVYTIDLRTTEKPLVLLPVYQRLPFKLYHRDQILRSAPITPNAV